MFRIFVLGLVISQCAAVVNTKAEAQRREAPADTYGPPPQFNHDLPTPVYGVPTGPVAKYPPPPPDVPPPQYGVPIQKYGPPRNPSPVYGPPQGHHHFQQQQQHHHHHHHQQHQQHEVSFLDQLKSTFGFGGPSKNYGPPPPPPHRKPHFPQPNYGPPPQAQLLPVKNFGSFSSSGSSSFSSGAGISSHSAPAAGPIPTYGPPPHLGPHFDPDIRCDGWKPIPGPAIQPNTGYGVPSAGGNVGGGAGYHANLDFGQQVIESSHAETHSHGGSADSNQGVIFDLPSVEAKPFHIESNNFAQGNLETVKSNSFEVSGGKKCY